MCGINGIYSNSQIYDIDFRIKKMNESISHRGPDGSGQFNCKNRIAFGHRRLSIIDTSSRSNQPMTSNSGRWTIVFNGEIYNYKKLKEKVNYDFKTTSDTEVILAFVEEYGIEEFLKHSNGMFAIALYDNTEQKVFLARDRVGIKPLFYSLNDSNFIFSSEIKGILSSGLVEAEFNEEAIDEYLGNRYIREPNTFFKNIYQLAAGTYVLLDVNLTIKYIRFWDFPLDFNMDKEFNEDEIALELEQNLREAIERRLISDVPLGTYLSGGLDSSLITAITSKILGVKLNTYTIGFSELNEFEYAEMVAKKYNTEHHVIQIDTTDYFNTMEEVISYKDAPLSVPNEITLALMSRILKEKITVVLSGEGADELLGGYGRIFRSPFDYLNIYDGNKDFYQYFIDKYEYVPRNLRDKFLNTSKILRENFDTEIRNYFNQKSNEESVFRFFHKYHVKGLLQRLDTTTMLAGVEARVPFLDHQLIEFSYRKIPYDLKLKWKSEDAKNNSKCLASSDYSEINDIPKFILKKISYNYLPKEIIERKKVGFPVPLNKWLTLLEETAIEHLKEAYWLKYELLDELLEESKKDSRAGQIIWMFLNIEIFRKKYFLKKWRF